MFFPREVARPPESRQVVVAVNVVAVVTAKHNTVHQGKTAEKGSLTQRHTPPPLLFKEAAFEPTPASFNFHVNFLGYRATNGYSVQNYALDLRSSNVVGLLLHFEERAPVRLEQRVRQPRSVHPHEHVRVVRRLQVPTNDNQQNSYLLKYDHNHRISRAQRTSAAQHLASQELTSCQPSKIWKCPTLYARGRGQSGSGNIQT